LNKLPSIGYHKWIWCRFLELCSFLRLDTNKTLNSIAWSVCIRIESDLDQELFAFVFSNSDNLYRLSKLRSICYDLVVPTCCIIRNQISKAYCKVLWISIGSVNDCVTWIKNLKASIEWILLVWWWWIWRLVTTTIVWASWSVIHSIKKQNFNKHDVTRLINRLVSNNMSLNPRVTTRYYWCDYGIIGSLELS
jgi:hypothetical protein